MDYEQNYQPNPESQMHKKYNIDVSDMPDGLNYLFIFPFLPHHIDKQQNKSVQPHIFTYTQDDLSIKNVIKRYEQEIAIKKSPNDVNYLTLQLGKKLSLDMTLKDLSKILNRDDVNGMFFFIKTQSEDNEDEYIDQCALQDYLAKSQQLGSKYNLNIKFMIYVGNNKPELLNMKVNTSKLFNESLNEVLTEIQKKYGVLFNKTDIMECYELKTKHILDLHKNLLTQKVYQNNQIVLKLKGNIKLKKLNIKDYNSYILIYKQGETDPFRAKYEEIADMKFIDLYKLHLELQKSKSKRDAIYCLKIMDMIIKPYQTISKAQVYFKCNSQNKAVNIVGKVVNQKMIFYKTIPALSAKAQFKLNDLKIPKEQQKHRENCRKKIQERAMKATQSYFKNNAKNVEPILIYTSELKHLQPKTNKEESIYFSINKYLRETNILTLDDNQFEKEWKMKYTSTLMKHLQNIPDFAGQTWRGVGYDPQISKIGQIVTFKQFTSTSTKDSVALSFAKQSNRQPCHIFKLKVLTGKPLHQYSLFDEKQVLLMPFTEFQVKAIKDQMLSNKKCKVYYLEQILTSRQLPDIKANFIIWIDDKLKENQSLYDNFKLQKESTVLQQIVSTSQLKKWLDKNEKLLSDKTAKVIFISNMSRKQINGFNQLAGIDAAKLIRQKHQNFPVYFYIGNIAATQQKLNASRIQLTNITVGNHPSDLLKYINNMIN